MIDHKTMMGIIATEAIEGNHAQRKRLKAKRAGKSCPTVRYDLRLVREKDGSLHWED